MKRRTAPKGRSNQHPRIVPIFEDALERPEQLTLDLALAAQLTPGEGACAGCKSRNPMRDERCPVCGADEVAGLGIAF